MHVDRKDRLVLVERGSAGEERIWVVGAWFVDWPVKKGTGRGAWFMDCWSLVFKREREREK